jgi:hypothetical protein
MPEEEQVFLNHSTPNVTVATTPPFMFLYERGQCLGLRNATAYSPVVPIYRSTLTCLLQVFK